MDSAYPSIEPTIAATDGSLESNPKGCVTSAPRTMNGRSAKVGNSVLFRPARRVFTPPTL